MTDKRPTVNLTSAEAEAIERAAAAAKLGNLSFSNLARRALAQMLKIDLPDMERGGIREGGFEPGNELQRLGHKARAAKARKRSK